MKKLLLILVFCLTISLTSCKKDEDIHEHAYVDGICSCGQEELNRLFIEYDKEVVYTQYGKLKVKSTYANDTIKIVSRNFGVLKVDNKQENDMILYGACPGVATVVVSNSYGEQIELTINVVTTEEYSPIVLKKSCNT